MWVAWIIREGKLADRYAEAEKSLHDVIDRHRNAKRVQANMKAAKEIKNRLIEAYLLRTELKSHQLLIYLYNQQEQFDKMNAAIDDYVQLYKGHSSCKPIEAMKRQ
jgi:hypothetical protein